MSTSRVTENIINLLFPVIEFVAWSIPVAQICLGPDVCLLQCLRQFFACLVNLCTLLVGRTGTDPTGDDDDLDTCYPRGKDETLVVAVHHDHNTDRTRGKAPGILPDICLTLSTRVVRVLNEYVEHLRARKILPEAVGSGSLDPASGCWDKAFYGGGIQSSGEFFFLRFHTGDDGDCQELLVDAAVEVKNLADFGVCLSFGEMSSVALLPEELACTQEGLCG